MKVLLINGSPNVNGCTYTALKEVADTLEKEGVETVTEATSKATGVYFDSGEELMKYFLGK